MPPVKIKISGDKFKISHCGTHEGNISGNKQKNIYIVFGIWIGTHQCQGKREGKTSEKSEEKRKGLRR